MNEPTTSGRRTVRKIRYHDHEWDEVVEQARACGLQPAAFVRKVSLGHEEEDVVLALGRIATALHGLMRRAPEVTQTQIQPVLDEALGVIRRVEDE